MCVAKHFQRLQSNVCLRLFSFFFKWNRLVQDQKHKVKMKLWTTTQCCTVPFNKEEVKIVAFCVQSFRSEFKRTGKAVGVILKPFKIFPLPFFFWHLHIRPCCCWSNPLLCQSSCSASAWKHSETACFRCSRGKAGLRFKSPAPPDVP